MDLRTVLTVVASVLLVSTYGTNAPSRLDGRFVGGENANITSFLYQLSLLVSGNHICGAAIVNSKVAVTTAHCTNGKLASSLSVRAGSGTKNSGGEVIQVETIEQHPLFNSLTMDYDISVLILNSTTVGQVIALQPAGSELNPGVSAVVTGWSNGTSGESNSDQLQKITVNRINDTYCNTIYGAKWTPRMICFANDGKYTCPGDSGSPLVSNNQLVGLVSWGSACNFPHLPEVYTKISDSNISEYINSKIPKIPEDNPENNTSNDTSNNTSNNSMNRKCNQFVVPILILVQCISIVLFFQY